MSRKSNKTAHVLNLLAGGDTKEKSPANADKTPAPIHIPVVESPVDASRPLADLIKDSLNREIDETEEASTKQEERAAAPIKGEIIDDAPDVSPAETMDDSEKELVAASLAELIKDSINKTLDEDLPVGINPESEEQTNHDLQTEIIMDSELKDEVFSDLEPVEAVSQAIEEELTEEYSQDKMETMPSRNTAVISPEPEGIHLQPEPVQTAQTEPEPIQAVPALQPKPEPVQAEAIPEPKVEIPDPGYRYINVMELAVEDRLMEFMERFQLCTCDRCIMDTKALALTHLNPKYVVIENSSIPPMMSYYRNKYSINVITELTKSCLAILDNPHHTI